MKENLTLFSSNQYHTMMNNYNSMLEIIQDDEGKVALKYFTRFDTNSTTMYTLNDTKTEVVNIVGNDVNSLYINDVCGNTLYSNSLISRDNNTNMIMGTSLLSFLDIAQRRALFLSKAYKSFNDNLQELLSIPEKINIGSMIEINDCGSSAGDIYVTGNDIISGKAALCITIDKFTNEVKYVDNLLHSCQRYFVDNSPLSFDEEFTTDGPCYQIHTRISSNLVDTIICNASPELFQKYAKIFASQIIADDDYLNKHNIMTYRFDK